MSDKLNLSDGYGTLVAMVTARKDGSLDLIESAITGPCEDHGLALDALIAAVDHMDSLANIVEETLEMGDLRTDVPFSLVGTLLMARELVEQDETQD